MTVSCTQELYLLFADCEHYRGFILSIEI